MARMRTFCRLNIRVTLASFGGNLKCCRIEVRPGGICINAFLEFQTESDYYSKCSDSVGLHEIFIQNFVLSALVLIINRFIELNMAYVTELHVGRGTSKMLVIKRTLLAVIHRVTAIKISEFRKSVDIE